MERIKDDKSLYLAQDNGLTAARYDLDLIEKRCLYLIIKQVRHDYVETGVQRTLFDDLVIQFDGATLAKATDPDHLMSAYHSLRKLRARPIDIKREDGSYLNVGIINYAVYNPKSRRYEIQVSGKLLPYLVELAAKFTTYDLTVALTLKSMYSQRLYELCSQYKHRGGQKFFITVDEFRGLLKLGDKYKMISALRRYVIDLARKEIKELFDAGQCDLWFEYDAEKEGRNITRFWFVVHTKESQAMDAARLADTQQKFLYLVRAVSRLYKRDKKFVELVMRSMERNPDIVQPLCEKLLALEKDYKPADLAPLFRYILREDYDIHK